MAPRLLVITHGPAGPVDQLQVTPGSRRGGRAVPRGYLRVAVHNFIPPGFGRASCPWEAVDEVQRDREDPVAKLDLYTATHPVKPNPLMTNQTEPTAL